MASPTACVLAAQAVRQLRTGPRAPVSMATWPAAMFGSCSSSRTAVILSMATRMLCGQAICCCCGVPAGDDAAEEGIVVERAFAGAEIDSHAGAIDAVGRLGRLHLDARLPAGLRGRPDRESRAPAASFVQLRVGGRACGNRSLSPRRRTSWGTSRRRRSSSCWRRCGRTESPPRGLSTSWPSGQTTPIPVMTTRSCAFGVFIYCVASPSKAFSTTAAVCPPKV